MLFIVLIPKEVYLFGESGVVRLAADFDGEVALLQPLHLLIGQTG